MITHDDDDCDPRRDDVDGVGRGNGEDDEISLLFDRGIPIRSDSFS